MRRIVEVAIGRDSVRAAQAFYQCQQGESALFRGIALISGARVAQEIEVSPGVRIVTMPSSTAELPPYFPDTIHMNPVDLLGKTLLVVDHTVAPIFANPDQMVLPEDVFSRQQTCTELPKFDAAEFCQSMSLAADWAIECLSEWRHIDPDAIFLVKSSHAGSQINWLHKHSSRGNTTISEEMVRHGVEIYQARKSLRSDQAQKLNVPIDRWIKSKSDQPVVDTFIDLGIALESLYLSTDGNQPELNFRLRLRAAWFLEETVDGRRALMADLGKIYGLRSTAVHDGTLTRGGDTDGLLATAQQITRRSILKVVNHILAFGKFPDWNRLVLGDSDGL